MLNKIKKPDEYRIGYEFVELAEDIQKLRKAKLMLQHNISRKKVCKYTTLEVTELQVLNDLLNQREKILSQIPDIKKSYLYYGYDYVEKIIVKKMIEDNCTNQEIQEFVNLTEDYINKKEILEKENKQINYYKELIKNIEKHKLYHAQEVRKMKKQYNDIHNEGGEGYIPHFYTFEEYEYAKKQLAKLIKQQNK